MHSSMVLLKTEQLERLNKAEEIKDVLNETQVDLWKLRELALTEGGLVNDTLRKRAWPLLVGITQNEKERVSPLRELEQLFGIPKVIVTCVDAEQIERDVARCTWHLKSPSLIHQSNDIVNYLGKMEQQKQKLSHLIQSTLRRSYEDASAAVSSSSTCTTEQQLHYYQGFHDIASIILSALSSDTRQRILSQKSVEDELKVASAVLWQVSQSHLKDCLSTDFTPLQTTLQLTLFPLLARFDSQLHHHLYRNDVPPFFCLSWILTWFSHDWRDTELVKRLFDTCLVSHPLFCIYLTVALLTHPVNRACLLECSSETSLHSTLQYLPRNTSKHGYDQDDVPVAEDDWLMLQLEDDEKKSDDGSVDSTPKKAAPSSNLHDAMREADDEPPSVPLEHLISQALQYMRHVPPHQVVELAKRYYGKQHVSSLQAKCASSCFLDTAMPIVGDETAKQVRRHVKKHPRSMAVIALGLAPGTESKRRKRQRLRRRNMALISAAILVVFLAVTLRPFQPTQKKEYAAPKTPRRRYFISKVLKRNDYKRGKLVDPVVQPSHERFPELNDPKLTSGTNPPITQSRSVSSLEAHPCFNNFTALTRNQYSPFATLHCLLTTGIRHP